MIEDNSLLVRFVRIGTTDAAYIAYNEWPLVQGAAVFFAHLSDIWNAWDAREPLPSIVLSDDDFNETARILKIYHDTEALDPPAPFNGAVYTAHGIARFAIPTENPVFDVNGVRYTVNYVMIDRYELVQL